MTRTPSSLALAVYAAGPDGSDVSDIIRDKSALVGELENSVRDHWR